jgi:pyrroloquinoline quinone (PQQ) biosynthesis protein C
MTSGTTFSTKLRVKLQLTDFSWKFGRYEIVPSKYNARTWIRDYFLVMHSIIRSSVPLMQFACLRCSQVREEKLLISDLMYYYEKHIREEIDHDEWLLNDLEVIGVSRKEALSRKPLQAVAELVGSQYYWIYHWHPVCLLGYIAFLEGDPPTKDFILKLQEMSGYPHTAFSTLVKHSELDPHHRDDLNILLDSLHLTLEHERWIASNALCSANKFHEMWNAPPSM